MYVSSFFKPYHGSDFFQPNTGGTLFLIPMVTLSSRLPHLAATHRAVESVRRYTYSIYGHVDRRFVLVTMSGTSWTVNQECTLPHGIMESLADPRLLTVYAMAQASKAIVPKDVGGPFGKRIGVSVGGSLNWALIVDAYVTGRVNPSDWLRYSIVVLNWYVASYCGGSF